MRRLHPGPLAEALELQGNDRTQKKALASFDAGICSLSQVLSHGRPANPAWPWQTCRSHLLRWGQAVLKDTVLWSSSPLSFIRSTRRWRCLRKASHNEHMHFIFCTSSVSHASVKWWCCELLHSKVEIGSGVLICDSLFSKLLTWFFGHVLLSYGSTVSELLDSRPISRRNLKCRLPRAPFFFLLTLY